MPIFDYKCPSCNKVKKNVFIKNREEVIKCSQCHEDMKRLFPLSFVPHIWPADGIFLEHVSSKGKRFFSKKEMKTYAKRNNLEIAMLED